VQLDPPKDARVDTPSRELVPGKATPCCPRSQARSRRPRAPGWRRPPGRHQPRTRHASTARLDDGDPDGSAGQPSVRRGTVAGISPGAPQTHRRNGCRRHRVRRRRRPRCPPPIGHRGGTQSLEGDRVIPGTRESPAHRNRMGPADLVIPVVTDERMGLRRAARGGGSVRVASSAQCTSRHQQAGRWASFGEHRSNRRTGCPRRPATARPTRRPCRSTSGSGPTASRSAAAPAISTRTLLRREPPHHGSLPDARLTDSSTVRRWPPAAARRHRPARAAPCAPDRRTTGNGQRHGAAAWGRYVRLSGAPCWSVRRCARADAAGGRRRRPDWVLSVSGRRKTSVVRVPRRRHSGVLIGVRAADSPRRSGRCWRCCRDGRRGGRAWPVGAGATRVHGVRRVLASSPSARVLVRGRALADEAT